MADSLSLYGAGNATPSEKGFSRLPKSVLRLPFKTLTDAEKVVMAAIGSLDRVGKGTNATDAQIGAACGKTAKKVGPIIGRLVSKGWLIRRSTRNSRWLVRTWRFDGEETLDPHKGGSESVASGQESCTPLGGVSVPHKGGPQSPTKGGLRPPLSVASLDLETEKNSETAGSVGRTPRNGPLPTPQLKTEDRRPKRNPPDPLHRQWPEELYLDSVRSQTGNPFDAAMARLRTASHRHLVGWHEKWGVPLPALDPARRDTAVAELARLGLSMPDCSEKTPAGEPLAKDSPRPVGQTIHD